MAKKTWKKIKVDGKDMIEVTETTQLVFPRAAIEDQVRMAENDAAVAGERKADADARLADLQQQLDALPEVTP